MRELSLNVLDIAQNSISANAKEIKISLMFEKSTSLLTIVISDNGKGMDAEFLAKVVDPFSTTRTTRKVGMGLPLYKMEAENTGGSFEITSKVGVGTTVVANFVTSSIDCLPLGGIEDTFITLLQGSSEINFVFSFSSGEKNFAFSSFEAKEMLGILEFSEAEVLLYLKDYFKENFVEVIGEL